MPTFTFTTTYEARSDGFRRMCGTFTVDTIDVERQADASALMKAMSPGSMGDPTFTKEDREVARALVGEVFDDLRVKYGADWSSWWFAARVHAANEGVLPSSLPGRA